MSSPPSIPDDVKKCVRAVLLSSDNGVLLSDFCKDYYKLVGNQLPYKQLGFSSCESMVWAMPECVTVVATETDSQLKLYGRGDGVSFMTSAAKKAQKPKKRHGILSGSGDSQSRNAQKIELLAYSALL